MSNYPVTRRMPFIVLSTYLVILVAVLLAVAGLGAWPTSQTREEERSLIYERGGTILVYVGLASAGLIGLSFGRAFLRRRGYVTARQVAISRNQVWQAPIYQQTTTHTTGQAQSYANLQRQAHYAQSAHRSISRRR